jgi:hypothetical protein
MIEFLQENLSQIVSMVVMLGLLVLAYYLFIAKIMTKELDKKRISKNMATMTEDEKQLANQVINKTALNFGIAALIAYVVSLVAGYFI